MKRFATLALVAVGLLGAVAAVWLSARNRFVALEHLPAKDATIVSVDFAALRQAGILAMLAAEPSSQDPEYLSFLQASGFDYQRDLDFALLALTPDSTYFLVRGRFNQQKLETYAKANGGSCYNELCRLSGSTAQRRISFLPLRGNWMGLAVGSDDLAAAKLRESYGAPGLQIPREPVWLSAPASALERTSAFSPAARVFAAAVAGAGRVTFAIGASGADYAGKLEVICSSPKDAQGMARELSRLTVSLKTAGARDMGLAGLLGSGTFQASESKVFGYWPIPKAFLQKLASGA